MPCQGPPGRSAQYVARMVIYSGKQVLKATNPTIQKTFKLILWPFLKVTGYDKCSLESGEEVLTLSPFFGDKRKPSSPLFSKLLLDYVFFQNSDTVCYGVSAALSLGIPAGRTMGRNPSNQDGCSRNNTNFYNFKPIVNLSSDRPFKYIFILNMDITSFIFNYIFY